MNNGDLQFEKKKTVYITILYTDTYNFIEISI